MSNLHLDYSEYKALIGDYGVTEWTKYNWLHKPTTIFDTEVVKVDLSTAGTWSTSSELPAHTYRVQIRDRVIPSVNLYCKEYELAGNNRNNITKSMQYAPWNNSQSNFIVFRNDDCDTLDEMKEAVKGVYLWYVKMPQYQKVEYLQSSLTQYINTGFKPNNNTRVVCKYRTTVPAHSGFVFGARDSTDTNKFTHNFSSADKLVVGWASASNITLADYTIANHTVDFNKNKVTLDGETHTLSASTFQCSPTMALFACNQGNNPGYLPGTFRMYSCIIYDNGKLVRNFVPCVRTSDSKPGMYDTVNGVFYTNAGTGEFLVGGNI